MQCDPVAEIDLSALRHNLERVRAAAPGSRTLAVVKANAYGHGLERAARALSAADGFAVARMSEGVRLRQAGVAQPIVVLEGFLDQEELEAVAAFDLEPVLNSPFQIDLLAHFHPIRKLRCWLKVDSGMHRLGFPVEEALAAHHRLSRLAAVAPHSPLITHLSDADAPHLGVTSDQLRRFLPLVEQLGVEASVANSGGILGWPASHRQWVRPGIMLYGASPYPGHTGADHGLKPVMTLRARVIAINRFQGGEPIGYSRLWSCPEEMSVGVVAIGYADGYPRHAKSGTPVLINGTRAPLVGRVSMDMITVDLRRLPDARVGDWATLWGEGLPAEDVAAWADTIPYQLTCCITGRVQVTEKP
jgi:alanine racemase